MEYIKSLSAISFDELYTAHADAFSDYERTLTKEELGKMIYRRGYVPELSFGAFYGNKLVSFTLNGIGVYNGVKTAYDTSTGTIKDHRGKGLVSKIFKASIQPLRDAGVKQYLLEVLQHNTKAVSIYRNVGFVVSREFNYFFQDKTAIKLNAEELLKTFYFQEVHFDKIEEMKGMWDFIPAWQNSFDAILRKQEDFKLIGAFDGTELIGYGIIEIAAGDIPQFAIDKGYRKKGIGSAMLQELLKYSNHSTVRFINTETSCDSMTSFLEYHAIPLRGKQFEMTMCL